MKQIKFTQENLQRPTSRNGWWCFSESMILECAPLFDNFLNNIKVENELKQHDVIHNNKEIITDSEPSKLWIYFKKEKMATQFIENLNLYIDQKSNK